MELSVFRILRRIYAPDPATAPKESKSRSLRSNILSGTMNWCASSRKPNETQMAVVHSSRPVLERERPGDRALARRKPSRANSVKWTILFK